MLFITPADRLVGDNENWKNKSPKASLFLFRIKEGRKTIQKCDLK